MSDLINREDAIEILSERAESLRGMQGDLGGACRGAMRIIESLPSAEPERHRGEWIVDGHERGFSECSKCGYIAVSVLSERHYNFCPFCGADMRGDHE